MKKWTSRESGIGLALALALAGAACGGEATPPDGAASGAPRLLPLEPAQVAVNETLSVVLTVDNPQGLPLTYSWQGPKLPGLDRAIQLVGTPAGGELTYWPLASHVGEHELRLGVESSLGVSEVTLRLTVIPAASAAPIFLRPGPGATFDLALTACVSVDVEVRDDDSPSVQIEVVQGLPTGAELVATGPKTAVLEWCPTPSQVDASDRWPMLLEASDGDHEPTQHQFVTILRRPTKEGCPGEPPVIEILSPGKGESVVSSVGYDVRFSVTDDQGIRDAPIAYWTTGEVEDLVKPNLSEFSTVFATEEPDGTWRARLPALGLVEGEERVLSVVLSATDNDDPNGTACNHRTDTPVHRFVAVGGTATAAGSCAACDFSTQCASSLCAATPGGGRCVEPCGPACAIDCVPSTSVEGGVLSACGSAATQCALPGGGAGATECAPDEFEPNGSLMQAAPLPAGIWQAEICPGDVDYFRVEVGPDTQLTIRIAPDSEHTGDLDLALLDASGQLIAISATTGAYESLTLCSALDTTYFVRVYGYDGATGPYLIEREESSQSCCDDSEFEPSSLSAPRALPLPGLESGIICPYEDDYFSLHLDAPTTVRLVLVGVTGVGPMPVDVDLQVYGPSGAIVAAGETFGDEDVQWDATAGPHLVRVFGYLADAGEYLLESASAGAVGCADDKGCPLGSICVGGSCEDAQCTNVSQCPAGHGCPLAGPNVSTSLCSATCTANAQCRPEEACKWFYEGRFCGAMGSGAPGAPCQTFFDCGGQRSCIPWPKGYCARDGCASSADCEAGSYCVPVDGVGICLVNCWASDNLCRLADGYVCDVLNDTAGLNQFVCLPGAP